jgi:hypothetical protein
MYVLVKKGTKEVVTAKEMGEAIHSNMLHQLPNRQWAREDKKWINRNSNDFGFEVDIYKANIKVQLQEKVR